MTPNIFVFKHRPSTQSVGLQRVRIQIYMTVKSRYTIIIIRYSMSIPSEQMVEPERKSMTE